MYAKAPHELLSFYFLYDLDSILHIVLRQSGWAFPLPVLQTSGQQDFCIPRRPLGLP